MANLIGTAAQLLALGLLAVSAFAMHKFFGPLGLVVFLVFTIPAAGAGVWYGRQRSGGGGGSNPTAAGKGMSKGMREER